MIDLIDREYAIKRFCEDCTYLERHGVGMMTLCEAKQRAVDLIESFPSAQPERILYTNMSDAEFEKWLYEHGICNPNIHESIPCDAVPLLIDDAISELPSAQPQRKKGEWEEIEVIPEAYDIAGVKTWASEMRCNQCGFTTFAIEGHFAQYDFCPSCGADMRGESDE